MVGKTGHGVETDHGPGALDGMKGAEELIDRLPRRFPGAERQCGLFDLRQKVFSFL